MRNNKYCYWIVILFITLLASTGVYASESDIVIPDLTTVHFGGLGGVSGVTLMYLGLVICLVGAVFGLVQYKQTKALPVHESMAKVSNTIWETCKTYLFTQGKFLAILWLLIAACMVYYFMAPCSDKAEPSANVQSSFCSPPSWASWAPTAWPGSASASTPSPIPGPPSPRLRATRWPPWASRSAPA